MTTPDDDLDKLLARADKAIEGAISPDGCGTVWVELLEQAMAAAGEILLSHQTGPIVGDAAGLRIGYGGALGEIMQAARKPLDSDGGAGGGQ